MASMEREPITGVWGGAPSGVQGQSLCLGGQGQSPLKLKAFQLCRSANEAQIYPFLLSCERLKDVF